MRKEVNSRTIWSLTLIRNAMQEDARSIEEAEFRFGRWTDEVLRSKAKRVPSGLRWMIEDRGLEDQVMESGIMVSMTAAPAEKEGWYPFLSTVEVQQTNDRWLPKTRFLFTSEHGGETLEFVDIYNPCQGGGMKMPRRIWARVEELPIETLAWAMGSGVLEGAKSRQISLSEWIGRPIDRTVIPDDIIALPGPPSRAYLFHDSD